jgi:hypothetical protein
MRCGTCGYQSAAGTPEERSADLWAHIAAHPPAVEHISGRSEPRGPRVACQVLFGTCRATCAHGVETAFHGPHSLDQIREHLTCEDVSFGLVRVACEPHGLATTLERGHSLADLRKVVRMCSKANGGTA